MGKKYHTPLNFFAKSIVSMKRHQTINFSPQYHQLLLDLNSRHNILYLFHFIGSMFI